MARSKEKINEKDVEVEIDNPSAEQQDNLDKDQHDTLNSSDKKKSKKAKSSHKTKQDELIEWKEKAAEINDKYLRLYSEFDNYRKRTIKEKIEFSKTASEEIIIELLPVLDDFQRALKAAQELDEKTPMFEGIELIYNKFKNTLDKKGLKPIEAIGEEFSTDFHEAITYIPATSDDLKGKIMDEIEKGYTLGEKVIRYSKVVIGQ